MKIGFLMKESLLDNIIKELSYIQIISILANKNFGNISFLEKVVKFKNLEKESLNTLLIMCCENIRCEENYLKVLEFFFGVWCRYAWK